jgi:hypothetical protein
MGTHAVAIVSFLFVWARRVSLKKTRLWSAYGSLGFQRLDLPQNFRTNVCHFSSSSAKSWFLSSTFFGNEKRWKLLAKQADLCYPKNIGMKQWFFVSFSSMGKRKRRISKRQALLGWNLHFPSFFCLISRMLLTLRIHNLHKIDTF